MTDAHLLFVLHGHLPWVNHPEHEFFLEEDWLFEAISDCYLPLLKVLDGLKRDGVDGALTLGLSPPLLSMLAEPNLRHRAARALDARVTLASRALEQLPVDSPFRPGLTFAREEAEEHVARYRQIDGELALAFALHHEEGRLELMTCGATHGLHPVLLDEGSIRAQIAEAQKTHERFLGVRPRGIWLPECGVTPLAFRALAEAGIVFTFTEDRALTFASPPPAAGPYRPIYSPDGVAFFARDPVAAKEVWSADEGYPGDFRYREFYRDLGYDADDTLLDPVHKQGTGDRKQVGVKVHRITGKVSLDDKQAYMPEDAELAVRAHAQHFVQRRIDQARQLGEHVDVPPCFTCSFDAELFGHWWHEGPWFLDATLRELARRKDEPGCPAAVSAIQYLEQEPTQQVSTPAVSSWGDGAAFSVWVNPENDWLWRKVHDARLRLGEAVQRGARSPLEQRALEQATREVMLAQSSDWPFILGNGTQTGYGTKRPLTHLSRAHRLLADLEGGDVDEADLGQMEERDGIFPDVDPSPFA